ncbi:hypothetical protein CDG76_31620 [Nostoc sp. 'Peltigera membranacea cyanobiont' 210A]|uniref:hypothetical protein n=1 Tax=Nostoc sp. 'Peltigera membranacea cyanobiont' 210A TaxID=2014529 RepID=UPI000B954734|nr:hypothetical protein [Nostoc sp. 'Peltigera membranacea cyanobiont' 210A]OYD90275.1 hypothetical protein CDG76_31620 [Nostoc sp. 'Peltigera membranacea cyanobiont' 210A]
MKSIETIATVPKDGKITAQLPLDIPEGEHQLVIVIDEKLLTEETENKEKKAPLKFSAYPVGLVSESLTFRREDLYAND